MFIYIYIYVFVHNIHIFKSQTSYSPTPPPTLKTQRIHCNRTLFTQTLGKAFSTNTRLFSYTSRTSHVSINLTFAVHVASRSQSLKAKEARSFSPARDLGPAATATTVAASAIMAIAAERVLALYLFRECKGGYLEEEALVHVRETAQALGRVADAGDAQVSSSPSVCVYVYVRVRVCICV